MKVTAKGDPMNYRPLTAALICFAFTVASEAHTPNDPPHQLFGLGDFKLESGEVIKEAT
jgi:hypothetical protein